MESLVQSSQRVRDARENITAYLNNASPNHAQVWDPQELIREVSGGINIDAYRAAMQSLIASGVLERSSGWTVRLGQATGQ
jgi:YD repeat-containing protein